MKTNTQLSHSDHKKTPGKFPLSVLANDLNSPLNTGSLFRLCDALGIKKLYLCGDTPRPPNSKINKTSRSTEKFVAYEYHENAEQLIDSLKQNGTLIVSLEITSSSIALNSKSLADAINRKGSVCLIIGAEKSGISEALLSLSDFTVHIPMLGFNSSMNVVSATSIACYEIISMIQARSTSDHHPPCI